jgi:hypothetical protein
MEVTDIRKVKSSNGEIEQYFVITTPIEIGDYKVSDQYTPSNNVKQQALS